MMFKKYKLEIVLAILSIAIVCILLYVIATIK